MPLVEDKDDKVLPAIENKIKSTPEVVERTSEASTMDVVKATARNTFFINSYFNDTSEEIRNQAPNFDFDPFEQIEGYEENSKAFIRAQSQEDVDLLKAQIDREREDKRIMAENPILSTAATLGMGVLNPINFIPVAGVAYNTYRTGGSILKGAMTTGAATAGVVAADEALLHHSQLTRTFGESAVNVGAGAFLGGVLGGYSRHLDISRKEAFEAGLKEDLEIPAPGDPDVRSPNETAVFGMDTAGAASLQSVTKRQESLSSALGMNKATAFSTPGMRTLTSDSLVVRRLSQDLAENPLVMNKNVDGIASPVALETLSKQKDISYVQAIDEMDDLFISYRKGRDRRLGDVALTGVADIAGSARRQQKLNYTDFKKEVSKAISRGYVHSDPEVAKAAKVFGDNIYKPIADKAIEVGLLDKEVLDNVVGATNYINRVWNTPEIVARRPEFEDLVFKHISQKESELQAGIQKELYELKMVKGRKALKDSLQKQIDDLQGVKNSKRKIAKLEERIELLTNKNKRLSKIAKLEEDLRFSKSEAELKARASEITDRIANTPEGVIPYEDTFNGKFTGMETDTRSGAQMARVFDIPDEVVFDFLDLDIERISRMYQNTMVPDILLKQRFGRVDMQDQIRTINEDYARLREGVKDPKLLNTLNKRQQADLRDVAALRDRFRGVYGMAKNPHAPMVRTAKAFRAWNFNTLLGGMTVSAIPDMAKMVGVNGMKGLMRDGLVPLVRGRKAIKLSKKESQLAGVALESALSTRISAISEVGLEYAANTKFERGVQAATNVFGVATLMNGWNDVMKSTTARIVISKMQDDIVAVAKGSKSKKAISRLAESGIDSRMAKAIYRETQTHGEKIDGVFVPNTEKWDISLADNGITQAYRAAIAREVDRAIVTPGIGDRPLWLSTEWGKTVGQFQSFMFSSMQRTTLPMLQAKDIKTLEQLVTGVGLGMMVYYLKTPSDKISDNTEDWIAEGVDRSGLLGWIMNANNMLEKASLGNLGLSPMLGKQPMSRYQSRNFLDALAGPSAGKLQSGVELLGATASGEWTQQDTRALRRLVPFQNMFYLRSLFDKIEEGTNETFGIRER